MEHGNWAGNVTFAAHRLHHPESLEQIQTVVRESQRVKVIGSRHSFTAIADSPEIHISLAKLDLPLAYEPERSQVTVPAGITYGRLCQLLHEQGYALGNMASLPHITVAGACSTATHGSGDGNGNLATAVKGMEVVTADGAVVTLSRNPAGEHPLEGAVVGLGGLGVVTRMTLEVVPAYQMQQEVYVDLPSTGLYQHFDDIASSAYSVSLFTDWQPEGVNQVWLKRRLADGVGLAVAPGFFDATRASVDLHPVASLPAEACTPQMGVPGPWHERLPHFRVDHTPASGDELQTEYFVPRLHAVDALRAVAGLGVQMAPILWISEVRTVAADDLWMSPCYGRESVAIHFSWKKDWASVRALLPRLEARLAPFQARPHWGKLFAMPASHLQTLYPRLADFRALLRHIDPMGKFRNRFLDTYILGDG